MRYSFVVRSLKISLFLFGFSFSGIGPAAIMARTVHAVVPIRATNDNLKDCILYFFISNPSDSKPQTVKFSLKATGEYYFSAAATAGQVHGSNLLTCSDNRNCSLSSIYQAMAPGENRNFAIRVRRVGNSVNYPNDQGVSLTISVAESVGYLLASGSFQQENANGIAYIGSQFLINAGRPF